MAAFDAGTIEAVLRLRDEFTGVATRVATQARTLGTRFTDIGQRARAVGAGLTTGVTLPLAAVGVGALKASIDFEDAFAGVVKTVDDAADDMGRLTAVGTDLQQGFLDLSKEIPIAATELAGVGEVAGQLGIKTENILGFTETMAKLGVTTNLSAEEAATSLARLANITGLPQTEFDRLGSTVVDLGNNFATTEAEIVDFGTRIAGAGEQAGLSEANILAIGAAMTSVGVGAEAGGTAVQKVLLGMTEAVATGSDELTAFAATAGLTSAEFATAFRSDAAGAFTAFVEGLGVAGDDAFQILEELGLQDQRLIRGFLSLANAGDLLSEAIGRGNTAFDENAALAKEAEIKFRTTSAQLKILVNTMWDAARTLGDSLKPALLNVVAIVRDELVPWIQKAADWFAGLSPSMQKTILVAVGLVAALGPLLLVVGQMSMGVGALLPLLGSLGSGFAMLMTPSAAFAAVLGKVGLLLAPLKALLLAVGGAFTVFSWPVTVVIAALAALLVGTEQGRAVLAAIGRVIKEVVVFAFNLLRDVLVGAGEKVGELGKKLIEMIPQVVLDKLDKLAKWIGGVADAIGRTNAAAAATDHLARLNQEMLDLGTSTGLTKEAMDRIARQAIELRDKGQTLTVGLARIVDHFQKTTLASEQLQATLEAVAGVTSIADLSNMTMRLAESGQSSSDVMKVIAERARALQTDGSDLTTVLQNVVNAYGEAATAGEAFGENTGGATPPVKALAKDVQTLIDTWTGASLESKALVAAFETLTVAQRGNDRVMTQVLDAYDSMRTVLGPFNAELEQLWQTHERLKTPLESNTDLTDRLTQAQVAATQAQDALNEKLDAHRRALLNLPTDQAITAFEELRMTWDELSESERADATEAYSAALKQAAESGIRLTAEEAALVGQAAGMNWVDGFFGTLSRAFEGGGGFMGGIKSLFSKGLGQIFSSITGGAGGGFTQALGKIFSGGGVLEKIGSTGTKIGSGIGKFMSLGLNGVPIVGPFLAAFGGPLIKGVGKLFKKMFGGPSEAELAGRKTAGAFRDGVIATLNDGQLAEASQAALGAWRGNEQGAQFLIGVRDAYVSVGRSAAEAEAMVNRLWEAEARGPEAVAAVQREMEVVLDQTAELRAEFEQIAELQTFDSATDQLQQLTSAAEFFGVAADQMGERLGNAFQAVEQAATAEDIAQHFHTLLASGVDLGTALDLAKDKVQGVITASVQMGTEIPASMQPIAAQLIAQGQLLDASGKKITDINQLEFGTSMTEGLQILVLSMNQLVETMGGEIPAAARRFAQGVGDGARDAEQTLHDTVLAQVENIGLAVHDLSVEDLAQMAAAFEVTAQAAGLSLEGVLGEQLDALKAGLESTTRDELPGLARAFQQTATDAVQAFDRIPRTLTFEQHTRYSSSGSPGTTNGSGLQSGTHGRFVDFGGGTSVVLHGRERVVTEAEGRREAADLSGLRQELADLKRIMERGQDELPFRMSRAIRDAMAETV